MELNIYETQNTTDQTVVRHRITFKIETFKNFTVFSKCVLDRIGLSFMYKNFSTCIAKLVEITTHSQQVNI